MEPKHSTTDFLHLEILAAAISKRYGYEFGGYNAESLARRVSLFCDQQQLERISQLVDPLINDAQLFHRFIDHITVPVTEMFRDPPFYNALAKLVLPRLASYPHFKVWHAGCANGAEPFSVAILLKLQNLLGRALIYGTDINSTELNQAKKGIFSRKQVDQYQKNFASVTDQVDLNDFFLPAVIRPS